MSGGSPNIVLGRIVCCVRLNETHEHMKCVHGVRFLLPQVKWDSKSIENFQSKIANHLAAFFTISSTRHRFFAERGRVSTILTLSPTVAPSSSCATVRHCGPGAERDCALGSSVQGCEVLMDFAQLTMNHSPARHEGTAFSGEYGPAGDAAAAAPGSLEHFLTERYCLYARHRARLYRADIHHRPWPLQEADATIDLNTMPPDAIPLEGEPLLHFSRRQDVVVWPLERVQAPET